MRWHERPMAQTALIIAVMAGVLAVQNVFVTQLFPNPSAKIAKSSAYNLSKVAAVPGCPIPTLDGVEDTHPTFDATSATESDPFNNFGPAIAGLSKASESKQKFESVIPQASIDAGHIKLGNVLDGAIVLAEAMTPSGSYANQNAQRPSDGTVIKIKTTPGQVIRAPDSGRQISGSGDRYTGMVMYASADGVRFANSRNDKPTGNEGYNLYIWNINTNATVLSNYRRSHDEFKRKCFPQFRPGDVLGTAKGDFIYMALRDNGDFVTIRDTSWWDGKVTAGQAAVGGGTSGGTNLTATPGTGAPACPSVARITAHWDSQNNLEAVKIYRGTANNNKGYVKLSFLDEADNDKKKHLFGPNVFPDSDGSPDEVMAQRNGPVSSIFNNIKLTNGKTIQFYLETQQTEAGPICDIQRKTFYCTRSSASSAGYIECSLTSPNTTPTPCQFDATDPGSCPPTSTPVSTTAPTAVPSVAEPTTAPTALTPIPPTSTPAVNESAQVGSNIQVTTTKVDCDGIESNGKVNFFCLFNRYQVGNPGPDFKIKDSNTWHGTTVLTRSMSAGSPQELTVVLRSLTSAENIEYMKFLMDGQEHIIAVNINRVQPNL